ncbi:MAG TPA: metalloregulator ArsR/SmtB family transcription factor [Usitatibacter sp.]|nr:metalloregulator ArsR/SmtB family transcription factor [Usitatibacter sp.]
MNNLDEDAMEEVARYFAALSTPIRLKILSALMEGEASVGELTARTGCTQANVSKHLAVLAQNGMVAKTAVGTSAYYRISDPRIHKLCALVCSNLGRRHEEQAERGRSFIAAAGTVARARPKR